MSGMDDRPLKALSDKRLQAERHRLQELAAECSNSIAEIKRELLIRAVKAIDEGEP